MKPEEYLETILKAAFERELEVSENVARTLPFFTASLAVAVPLYGYVAGRLPSFSFSPLSLILHSLLAAGASCGVMILWSLFQMVRIREYRLPPRETAQIEWMYALKAYFEAQGLTQATIDRKVSELLRTRMIAEYAASAEHNREAEAPKLRARASGVFYFVLMLAIAFAMIAIIFISQRLPQPPLQEAAHVAAKIEVSRAAVARRLAAAPTASAGSETRPEVSGGAGGEHRVGRGPEMIERDKSASNTPAPPSIPAGPVSQPPPPPHQLLKKSDEGAGPLSERR